MHNSKHAPNPSENLPTALSPRELAARRANAKKCTGPRTDEGKAAARLNAITHGFFACDVVNPILDGSAHAEEFNSLLDALLEEFQPESASERILVDEVAASCWRIRRILRYECRESWRNEDAARRKATSATATESLLTSMGYEDNHRVRRRTAAKVRRSGLDALVLPSFSDLDKIVRIERIVKRNLYRALDSLERIQASRGRPQSSDQTSS